MIVSNLYSLFIISLYFLLAFWGCKKYICYDIFEHTKILNKCRGGRR